MSLTITAAQRDAFYDQSLDRISGIGDIAVAIAAENFEDAERLARDYSDDLRFLLDLGIGEGTGGSITLTTPPKVLLRVLPRLRFLASGLTASLETQHAEIHELEKRSRVISEACEALLGRLRSEPRSGEGNA